MAREGLESVFFLIAVFGQSSDHKMPLGAVAGLATAVVIGVLLYQGGIRLNLGKFFRWTGVFLIFVAAGLLSGSFRALHEAGVWNIGQTILFDWSKVLHEDSPLGVLMGGFFGYTDHPTVSDIRLVFRLSAARFILVFTRQQSRFTFPLNPLRKSVMKMNHIALSVLLAMGLAACQPPEADKPAAPRFGRHRFGRQACLTEC